MNRNLIFILFLTLSLLLGYKCSPWHFERLAAAYAETEVQKADKEEVKDSSLSEQTPNPFLTLEEQKAIKSHPDIIPINYLMLTAIFYSPLNSRAIVDGEILKKGDFIDNKEVISILPEEIILKDNANRYVLRMRNILNRNQN